MKRRTTYAFEKWHRGRLTKADRRLIDSLERLCGMDVRHASPGTNSVGRAHVEALLRAYLKYLRSEQRISFLVYLVKLHKQRAVLQSTVTHSLAHMPLQGAPCMPALAARVRHMTPPVRAPAPSQKKTELRLNCY